ncbi:MAG: hypothetical protein WBZ50_10630, partial [Nitrososphaeraceae archaeon]
WLTYKKDVDSLTDVPLLWRYVIKIHPSLNTKMSRFAVGCINDPLSKSRVTFNPGQKNKMR